MFKKQNKIIIVDNTRSELERLGKAFLENGLGCRTFLYTTDYDEEPLKNVRLAFFDINLTSGKEILTNQDIEEITKNNTSVLNDIAFALQQFIHEDNGPYALIFWTKNSVLIDAIKSYIQDEKRGYNSIPSPIYIGCLNKVDYDDTNVQQLSEKVGELITTHPGIKFLFEIEENSRVASENTLNRLYKILPKTDPWGDSQQLFEHLDKILSKIAASTLGFGFARKNPKRGVYEGLLPLLNHEFLKTDSDAEWNKIVSQLTTAKTGDDIVSPDENIQFQINALYHIEDYEMHSKDVRGCVIEIDRNKKDILKAFNISKYEDWFGNLIPISNKSVRRKLRDNSKLVAVEFSAACDYSNNKSRINKYILGVLTDNFDIDSHLDKQRKPESSYHLGGCCFQHNTRNYNIWLNLNYVFGATGDDPKFEDPLFILKKEIMDMLGNKYASHVSRIGITSF